MSPNILNMRILMLEISFGPPTHAGTAHIHGGLQVLPNFYDKKQRNIENIMPSAQLIIYFGSVSYGKQRICFKILSEPILRFGLHFLIFKIPLGLWRRFHTRVLENLINKNYMNKNLENNNFVFVVNRYLWIRTYFFKTQIDNSKRGSRAPAKQAWLLRQVCAVVGYEQADVKKIHFGQKHS